VIFFIGMIWLRCAVDAVKSQPTDVVFHCTYLHIVLMPPG